MVNETKPQDSCCAGGGQPWDSVPQFINGNPAAADGRFCHHLSGNKVNREERAVQWSATGFCRHLSPAIPRQALLPDLGFCHNQTSLNIVTQIIKSISYTKRSKAFSEITLLKHHTRAKDTESEKKRFNCSIFLYNIFCSIIIFCQNSINLQTSYSNLKTDCHEELKLDDNILPWVWLLILKRWNKR